MKHSTDQIHTRRSAWRRNLGALGVFVLFAGMLFWTKLRLVSDIPRTAYAVPREEQPDSEPATPKSETDPELDEDVETSDD